MAGGPRHADWAAKDASDVISSLYDPYVTLADPEAPRRERPWASPLGWGLLALAGAIIIAAPFTTPVPYLPSALSLVAGFAIGIGYQFQPFLHRQSARSHSRKLGGWLLAGAGASFASAVIVVALGWVPRVGGVGLVLLASSIALLLVGLTELYPDGANLPGVFLIPVGLDGLMLQSMASTWSNHAQSAVALGLLVPATGAAVVLTVWAFRIRSLGKVAYVRATETARGVLWAWTILVAGVLTWKLFGVSFTDSSWANPVSWALPLVTVGSVLAAATTGWSKYVEAREELASGATSDSARVV